MPRNVTLLKGGDLQSPRRGDSVFIISLLLSSVSAKGSCFRAGQVCGDVTNDGWLIDASSDFLYLRGRELTSFPLPCLSKYRLFLPRAHTPALLSPSPLSPTKLTESSHQCIQHLCSCAAISVFAPPWVWVLSPSVGRACYLPPPSGRIH